ncbi:DNA mismatch repair protein MSH3 isoform X5 [Magnolia sinica]|uniref:DNA mismatch repair protein MSH3 isoform X5 n=1 Tax=Magnolia sinica TaxID=86752 RepID=UPI002657CF0E|nr:DNA mismatch repair protein MSH3 isoform X5 [Magnolia sinica]
MGKQKQQVISRFFAPKPNPSSQSPSPSQSPFPNPPKISATVSFSPSKRSKTLEKTLSLTPPPSKKPKTLPPPPPPPSSLNQRFLQKLLEPSPSSSSPCATTATATANAKYTPLEQQVLDLKSRYPDVLLMVEVGYRYRFFGPDAETAAKVLGIQAHVDHSFLTASIPTFRLQFHIRRLVTAGYKVGVVKQTETATIKSHGSNRAGPFARGLSALYTRATLEAAAEEVGGGGDGGNYLVCVVEKGALVENRDCGVECNFDVKVGLIGVEISTGEFMYGEFNDGVTRAVLESVVLSLAPAEILLGEPVSAQTEKLLLAYAGPSSNVRVERASGDSFKDGGALAEVMSLYENISEDVMKLEPHSQNAETSKEEKHLLGIEGIMAMPELAVRALALTIRYLKQFGFERILCLGASFRPFSSKAEMTLSANALQQLEVLKNNSDGSENGSLLQSMNHTLTAFGSRLLRHWVTHPLCDRNSISARLDAVSEIAESMGPCRVSQDVVILDEEGSCSPITQSEVDYLLSSVLTTLGRSPDIQRGITRIFHRTATPVEFISVIHAILSAGKQLQQLHIEDQDNDWIVPGKTVQSSLLRRLILTASSSTITSHGVKLLSALNKEAATQGDLQNLFIASNGQFPEVARGQIAVQIASEKLDLLIGLYRKQLGMHNLEFMSVSGSTHLIEVLESILQENFVPNDTNLHLDGEYCQIITGPNMGGKSCYIRQVALIAIMAQVGSFVPASSAKFHVLDGIYTRIGASDSIQRGMSTFFEELSEASHILHNCTSRSLVIIDELGRGTSTHDGVAIAYATLHHLINQKKCMVLFVTHYPKIMAIKDDFPGSVGAYHVSYLTPQKNPKLSISKSDPGVDNLDRGDVTFLYKVVPGMADKSFGLNVARLAQLPPSCIARASVMAAKLEAEVSTRVGVRLAQKVFPETLVCTEENLEEVNLPNQPEFSDGEQLRSSSVDGEGASEELVRAYHALFSCLQSALDGTNPTNSLLSLKESLKLAVRMVDDNRQFELSDW